ncbi:leucine ABC transporter subunit substrate-binding protein LivK, partial [Salmonella enterica subsp. enterica serovar Infantis]
KTIIAGIVAFAVSQGAMADYIKDAIVGAMSGTEAKWGDMEVNGARQASNDINAKGGMKGVKRVAEENAEACHPTQAVARATTIV